MLVSILSAKLLPKYEEASVNIVIITYFNFVSIFHHIFFYIYVATYQVLDSLAEKKYIIHEKLIYIIECECLVLKCNLPLHLNLYYILCLSSCKT